MFFSCSENISGCLDINACNYNVNANQDDGSCQYPQESSDCDGNCLIEVDCNGDCGGTAVEDEVEYVEVMVLKSLVIGMCKLLLQ